MQPAREDNALLTFDGEPIRPQTVTQCYEVIDAFMEWVARMQQQLAEQQGQIAWLQERVELDSRTSSKPPSSNGPGSGSRAQRRASGGRKRAMRQLPGAARRGAGRPDHRLAEPTWRRPTTTPSARCARSRSSAKVSGPTRSRRGDDFIARGYSVVESCRRQGCDALDYMHQAVTAWLHQISAPSLVPLAVPSG